MRRRISLLLFTGCLALFASGVAAQQRALVHTGSRATYLANVADPGIGAAWVTPDFDDSAWNIGTYGIGYDRQREAGGVPSGTEAYYSFDYANIHFVVLDSFDSGQSPSEPMLTWLEEDLASTAQDWIIAYWHHPPYSKGSHNSDNGLEMIEMRENALPILESHGVDLVLAGHSHSYERSFLIHGHYDDSSTLDASMIVDDGDGREYGDGVYQQSPEDVGTVYTVAGSSGKTSGGSLDHPVMIESLNVLGSVVLDVDSGRLGALFLDDDGTVRDYFTIEKGGNPNGEPPLPPTNIQVS